MFWHNFGGPRIVLSQDWYLVTLCMQAAVEAEMYQSVPSMRASVLDAMMDYILGAVTSVVTEQLAGAWVHTLDPSHWQLNQLLANCSWRVMSGSCVGRLGL